MEKGSMISYISFYGIFDELNSDLLKSWQSDVLFERYRPKTDFGSKKIFSSFRFKMMGNCAKTTNIDVLSNFDHVLVFFKALKL